MAKRKKQPEPKASDFFKPEELGPLPDYYDGHYLVMRPVKFQASYRQRHFLVWRAGGGFGCDPTKMGRAVFAECVGDGEVARWDRGDFVAEYIGDVDALKAEAAGIA